MTQHTVGTREEWLAARNELLDLVVGTNDNEGAKW
jgi:predicted dithiol-disulfide oxidoreductase (DUF899 family)